MSSDCSPGWSGHDEFETFVGECHVSLVARQALNGLSLGMAVGSFLFVLQRLWRTGNVRCLCRAKTPTMPRIIVLHWAMLWSAGCLVAYSCSTLFGQSSSLDGIVSLGNRQPGHVFLYMLARTSFWLFFLLLMYVVVRMLLTGDSNAQVRGLLDPFRKFLECFVVVNCVADFVCVFVLWLTDLSGPTIRVIWWFNFLIISLPAGIGNAFFSLKAAEALKKAHKARPSPDLMTAFKKLQFFWLLLCLLWVQYLADVRVGRDQPRPVLLQKQLRLHRLADAGAQQRVPNCSVYGSHPANQC